MDVYVAQMLSDLGKLGRRDASHARYGAGGSTDRSEVDRDGPYRAQSSRRVDVRQSFVLS